MTENEHSHTTRDDLRNWLAPLRVDGPPAPIQPVCHPVVGFDQHPASRAALTYAMVFLLTARAGAAVRWVARTTSVLFALAVAASRLYLGVHYPLDVVASFLSAAAAAFALWAIWSIPPIRNWVSDRFAPNQHTARHRRSRPLRLRLRQNGVHELTCTAA